MTGADLASALEGKKEGCEWRCRCPLHGGRSLCVTDRDGNLLLVCRAGCSQPEVIQALRTMGLWGNAACFEISPPPPAPAPPNQDRRADRATKMWSEARPITSGGPSTITLATVPSGSTPGRETSGPTPRSPTGRLTTKASLRRWKPSLQCWPSSAPPLGDRSLSTEPISPTTAKRLPSIP